MRDVTEADARPLVRGSSFGVPVSIIAQIRLRRGSRTASWLLVSVSSPEWLNGYNESWPEDPVRASVFPAIPFRMHSEFPFKGFSPKMKTPLSH